MPDIIKGDNRIYLATPYTKWKDKEFIYQAVTELTAKIWSNGIIVYSPITMTHPILKTFPFPKDFSFWSLLDKAVIWLWATQLWVAAFDGWQHSYGCHQEVLFAMKKHIPCALVDPNFTNLTPLDPSLFTTE